MLADMLKSSEAATSVAACDSVGVMGILEKAV
jgi:hypothetical protein